jgi:hypothetical protein
MQRPKFEGQSQSQSAYVKFVPEPQQNYKPQPSSASQTKDSRCAFLFLFCSFFHFFVVFQEV